jgi:hypothetical protein
MAWRSRKVIHPRAVPTIGLLERLDLLPAAKAHIEIVEPFKHLEPSRGIDDEGDGVASGRGQQRGQKVHLCRLSGRRLLGECRHDVLVKDDR